MDSDFIVVSDLMDILHLDLHIIKRYVMDVKLDIPIAADEFIIGQLTREEKVLHLLSVEYCRIFKHRDRQLKDEELYTLYKMTEKKLREKFKDHMKDTPYDPEIIPFYCRKGDFIVVPSIYKVNLH